MKVIKKFFLKLWHDAAKHNNQTLSSYIEPTKSARVLEIGPFRGDLILERVKNVKKPDIYAVDIDQEAIKSCQKLGIRAKRYDIEKGLPYKSNFFDIVSANQIIEHLVDIDLFMQEIYRVIKPNGYLVLSTENLSSWHNLFAIFLGWQAFSQNISRLKNVGNPLRIWGESIGEDIHRQIFTPRGLKEITDIHRLKIEKVFGAGYYPFWGNLSKIFSKIDPAHCAFIGLKARKAAKNENFRYHSN